MSALLDPALLGPLSRLTLVTRRRADGAPAGSRIGRRRGVSLEFADHRAYSGGDDLRFLDWKVLARHDQPFLRRFYEEQALPVRLLLDTSASMGFGTPAKIELARSLAAGLAFVALANGAVLSLHPFSGAPAAPLGPLRGRARFHAVLRYLEALVPAGESDFTAAAASVATPGRAGLVVALSDFLCPGGLDQGLARIDHARNTAFLLRVWSPEEEDPEPGGDLTLVDCESGAELPISLGPSLLAAYRRARDSATAGLQTLARKRRAGLALVRSDAPVREVLLATLPAGGLLE